ncbi:MAG: ACT domain-containing protein [Austwickia sp.]|jgi:glycine cleavage system regulatory protein|nr:MAG: ACT domain-containing protein [Austwickia sp.]
MATLVLTVIGDDQTGLVNALAKVVSDGGGNWEGSHLAELAGKFAGIVVVTVADERAEELTAALRPLAGMLEIAVHAGQEGRAGGGPVRTGTSGAAGASEEGGSTVSLELIGNDRPGIVREISGVFAQHGLSIAELATATREAPMAGGRLFEARLRAPLPAGADLDAVRADLERLADEILVDIAVATD